MEPLFGSSDNGGWSPKVELTEDGETYLVTAELPGCKAEDVKVTLTGRTLTVQGEKKSEEKREEENVHIFERTYGSFSRSFTFPTPVESDAVTAETEDGVLKVRVRKAEKENSRKIDVQAK